MCASATYGSYILRKKARPRQYEHQFRSHLFPDRTVVLPLATQERITPLILFVVTTSQSSSSIPEASDPIRAKFWQCRLFLCARLPHLPCEHI